MPPGLTDRPDAPAPMRRRGPRPLAMHLTPMQVFRPGGSGAPQPSAARAPFDPALIAGIAAYRRHPYRRALPDPPTLWQAGTTRLLDYGGAGRPVLFVPSLINRAYVLDLAEDRSMMRWLAARGVRPLLLDWGWPEAEERGFGLSELVTLRLLPAIAAAGEPVALAGYCMGGLLATAAAQLCPDRVASLALLATPWDFHAEGQVPRIDAILPFLDSLPPGGAMPIDALQAFFAMIEPGAVAAKFRAFSTLDPASPAAAMFVALEDWLADGIPLAAPVARACIAGWYGGNTPARGTWQAGGQAVTPGALRLPALVVLPGNDRIVPPHSARILARIIPGAVAMEVPLGHVGMVAGSRAPALVWSALLDWLRGPGCPISGRRLQ